MCIDCYEEYGSPTVDNGLVRSLVGAIRAVYEHNCVGGNLHIVLDDWNLDSIDSCREFIGLDDESSAAKLAAERRCLSLLADATDDEKASALAIVDGLWTPEPS